MLAFKGKHGYQAIKQNDSFEDSLDDTAKSVDDSINGLRKLFINSLFIQGYLASIITNDKCRNNDYDPIYGVICDYFGIKSKLNAVKIQANDIVTFLYQNDIDEPNINTEKEKPTVPPLYILNSDKIFHAPLLLAIDNTNTQIINTILQNDSSLSNKNKQMIFPGYNQYPPIYPQFFPTNSPISHCIDKLFEVQDDEEQTKKYVEITKTILKHKISPNALSKLYHNTSLLHYGCLKHDFEFVKSLIDQYNISMELALKTDYEGNTPMKYLKEYDDEDELKQFLRHRIAVYQDAMRKRRRQEEIPMDSGAGIYFYTLCTLCCFLPWTLIGTINASFYLYQWSNNGIHWSLAVLSIIMIVLGVSFLSVTVICFANKFYHSPDWANVMLVVTLILQQIFGIIFLIAQVVLDEYADATLALGITNVCFLLCFDCIILSVWMRDKFCW